MDLTAFPKTVIEFERRFPDEASCWQFLWEAKWPKGYCCPRCRGGRAYYVIDRKLEECSRCGYQASVTAGTLFHGTRSDLRQWFRAILEFVIRKHGCNAMDIQRLIGVSYPTAWRWLHKIREAIGRRNRAPLAGTVEVDEGYIGGPEKGVFGRNRGSKKLLVAVAVEVKRRKCGRARLEPVDAASAEALQTFVSDTVSEKARVRTDGLPSYSGLKHVYRHKRIVIGDPATASQKFPAVHRVISLFRRLLLGTYHGSWSSKYAPAYCEEFEFRFNRRSSKKRPVLFARIIESGQLGRPSIFRKSRGKVCTLRAS